VPRVSYRSLIAVHGLADIYR